MDEGGSAQNGMSKCCVNGSKDVAVPDPGEALQIMDNFSIFDPAATELVKPSPTGYNDVKVFRNLSDEGVAEQYKHLIGTVCL